MMHAWTRMLVVVWVGLLVVGCGAQQSFAPEAPGAPPAMAPDPSAQVEGPSPSASMADIPSEGLMASTPDAPGPAREDKPGAPQTAPAQGKTGSEKNAPIGNEGTRPLLIYEAHVTRGLPGRQMRYSVTREGRPNVLWVTVFVTPSSVFVVEAGGDVAHFEAVEKEVDKAVRNLDLG